MKHRRSNLITLLGLLLVWFSVLPAVEGRLIQEMEESISIGEILMEEWNSVADSIRTCHISMKIYRHVFEEGDEFSIEQLVEELSDSVGKGNEEEVLKKRGARFASTMSSGSPIWDYKVESTATPKTCHVAMHTESGRLYERYFYGPLGFASHHPQRGQIQVNSSGNRERFSLEDTIFLPEFTSLEEMEMGKSKVEGLLEVHWGEGRANRIMVNEDDFRVQRYTLQQGNRTTLGFNIGSVDVENFDYPIPRLVVEYSEADDKPDTLMITRLNSVSINQKIESGTTFKVGSGTTVIDLRKGKERASFHVPGNDEPSTFDYLRKVQSKQTKGVRSEKSSKNQDSTDRSHAIPVIHLQDGNGLRKSSIGNLAVLLLISFLTALFTTVCLRLFSKEKEEKCQQSNFTMRVHLL